MRWLALALLDLKSDPPATLILTFVIGIFIFAVTGNVLYDLLVSPDEILKGDIVARLVLGVGALLLTAYLSFRRYQSQSKLAVPLSENPSVPAKAHVITVLGPYAERPDGRDNLDPLRQLLQHHSPHLRHLHLISILAIDPQSEEPYALLPTHDQFKGVKTAYENLKKHLKDLESPPTVTLHGVRNADTAEESFEVVTALLEKLGSSAADDVILDITPGTKAMTVGLAGAAFALGFPMSYLATPRDGSGNPVFGESQRFVMVDAGKMSARILRRAVDADGQSLTSI